MEPLRYALQRLRESLFLVPAGVIALCIAAALVAQGLDSGWSPVADSPFLLSVTVSGARSIATVVAGATITVAAIVFSITALSSQIASSQFSPRAVAGFFENRFQQVIIGLVVGTFSYSLLVVAGLAGSADADEGLRRSISATLAVVLGIGSGIGIVAYIDHSLRRMRVGAVVRRIAEATVKAIQRGSRSENDGAADRVDGKTPQGGRPIQVRAIRLGWVRLIDGLGLARTLPPGSVARIEVRVGELIAGGDLVARVWLPGSQQEDDELAATVRRAIYIGRERSLDRDPEFGIRQLVDIALRALSPGINDPTTAIDVIQHLKIPLREILTSDPPDRIHSGRNLQRVFMPEASSRSDYVHRAFSEIRLAAATQPAVLRALLEVSADLLAELEEMDLEGRGSAVLEEALLTIDAARSAGFPEPDLKRVTSVVNGLAWADSSMFELSDDEATA